MYQIQCELNLSLNMENSLITVVTICYNAANILENTILSVINQTYSKIEYIIIDGLSTDSTMEIVNKYKDRISKILSEPDKGIYDAMNKGIKLATGDWIIFLNAGDQFVNNEIITDFCRQIEPSTIIAYGNANLIYKSMTVLWKTFPLNTLKNRMCFCHQSTFVNTIYHKKHLFDISYKISGDYNFFYEAYYKNQIKFQYIPLTVVNYEAENGMSAKNYFVRLKEDARLKGIKNDFYFKIKYLSLVVLYYIKLFFRFFMPQKILNYRRKKIFN